MTKATNARIASMGCLPYVGVRSGGCAGVAPQLVLGLGHFHGLVDRLAVLVQAFALQVAVTFPAADPLHVHAGDLGGLSAGEEHVGAGDGNHDSPPGNGENPRSRDASSLTGGMMLLGEAWRKLPPCASHATHNIPAGLRPRR